jgi:hypothetical protein
VEGRDERDVEGNDENQPSAARYGGHRGVAYERNQALSIFCPRSASRSRQRGT